MGTIGELGSTIRHLSLNAFLLLCLLLVKPAPTAAQCEENTSLPEHVTLSVASAGNTAEVGQVLGFSLLVDNSSSFELTRVTATGIGADLSWPEQYVIPVVSPLQSTVQSISATVSGQEAQPSIQVAYRWLDDAGTAHNAVQFVTGEKLKVSEAWHQRLPGELVGILAAVVTGAFAAAIPGFFERRSERRERERANCSRVTGILQLVVLQSRQAAGSAQTIGSTLLDSIFQEEGLYQALANCKELAAATEQLRSEVELYNRGVASAGGIARASAVVAAANRVQTNLDCLHDMH